ncbi:hypothetical protein EH31_16340 [Erythrobacter longus]|uniref:Uncharacterized protein n=1 Tax=Erythrobacter longus TaxID=1044 RepID=A0A074M9M9_ERYLO|nr:hypothetical protein EH31_16340 [Erythrobacter longus]
MRLYIARFADRLSQGDRFAVNELAIRIRSELRLIGVHRLRHADRPTLQKRNSSDCCRELG